MHEGLLGREVETPRTLSLGTDGNNWGVSWFNPFTPEEKTPGVRWASEPIWTRCEETNPILLWELSSRYRTSS